MPYLLLCLSVVLSAGRNLFSKKLSDIRFGTKDFFLCQSVLFLCGGASLVIFGKISFCGVAYQTLIYGAVYAALLIFAQWFYTAALAAGNIALCSTVYSLGFVLPTLSGSIFWSEPFSVLDLLGVLCAVSAVIVSGVKKHTKEKTSNSHYFIPLIISMLASGGLGIVQKLQQKSEYSDQKTVFLFIAFMLAAAASMLFALLSKEKTVSAFRPQKLAVASCIGVCFGCCNILNTTLAGMLPSAIFFPTLNICVIILSMLSGAVIFNERLSKKDVSVLILGGASILFLNFG